MRICIFISGLKGLKKARDQLLRRDIAQVAGPYSPSTTFVLDY